MRIFENTQINIINLKKYFYYHYVCFIKRRQNNIPSCTFSYKCFTLNLHFLPFRRIPFKTESFHGAQRDVIFYLRDNRHFCRLGGIRVFACKSLPPSQGERTRRDGETRREKGDTLRVRDMQMSLITGSGRITRFVSLLRMPISVFLFLVLMLLFHLTLFSFFVPWHVLTSLSYPILDAPLGPTLLFTG